jgi:hypothetical protein
MKSVDQYEQEGCDDLRRKNHFEKQKKICQPYLKYCSGVFGGGGGHISYLNGGKKRYHRERI